MNMLNINQRTFAMITDFGFDFAVASMKALILKNFPRAQIVDIDHSIKQYSILSGAFVIDKIYKYFPNNTIFICVIDPGVGSKREPIYIDIGNYKFVGPNNGLFYYILKDTKISYKSYTINKENNINISTTFHGRDLFTPAAIEIAKGNLKNLKPIEKEKLVLISALENKKSIITYIDGFGNIKTNVPFRGKYKKQKFLKIKIHQKIHKIQVSNTFSEVAKGELLCYRGSNNTLEIAANLSSAEKVLKVNVGDNIFIEQ